MLSSHDTYSLPISTQLALCLHVLHISCCGFSCVDAILDTHGSDYCSNIHSLRGSHSCIQIVGVVSTAAYRGKKIKLVTVNHRQLGSQRIQQSIDAQLKASAISASSSKNMDDQSGLFCSVW